MWQPIETAPRGEPLMNEDGPRVLLGWAGVDHIAIGHYGRRNYSDGPMWVDGYGGPIIKPTHWQPLPAPPPDLGSVSV